MPCAGGAGTRVLLVANQGISQQLPPVAALLTQAVTAAMTFSSRSYCSTELLQSPLSGKRMAGAAVALELFALPLVAMAPVTGEPV